MARRRGDRLATLVVQLRDEAGSDYHQLQHEIRDGRICIRGPFVLAETGTEIDRYEVEIVVNPDYPRTVPAVYELAGRIPRDADHHIYTDGEACLFVTGERWRYWPKGASFLDFLNGPVRAFFISQSLYELTGKWPFGQRKHGAAGIVEAYAEMLRTRDLPTILRYLATLARRKLRPHLPCPCSSGRAINRCHMLQLAALRTKIHYREAAFAQAVVANAISRSA